MKSQLLHTLRYFIVLAILLVGAVSEGVGQRVRIYANDFGYVTNEAALSSGGAVTGTENAVGNNAPNSNYSSLQSGPLIGQGNAKLQLKFLNLAYQIPTSVPLYIRTGAPTTGGISRADLLVQISTNATTGSGITGNPVSTLDRDNTLSNGYIRLTSQSAYNAVWLNVTYAGGLNGQRTGYVYHAYVEPFDFPLTFNQTSIPACDRFNLLEALNYRFDGLLDYEVLNSTGNVIPSSPIILSNGNYRVRAKDPNTSETKTSAPISVTLTPSPTYTLSQSYINIPTGIGAALPTVTSCTNCATTPVWKNESGTTVTSVPSNLQPGYYNYYVSVSNGSCETRRSIVVNVYDEENPCRLESRVYATISTDQANTTNASNARDGNPQTRSTLTSTLALLGLGNAYQTLQWSSPVPSGKRVTLKLNVGSGVLGVGSVINVQQYLNATAVGSALPVSGGLIQLLSGENDIYFSFVTTASIDRVRLNVGALLGLGITAHLYDAWYVDIDPDGQLECAKGDIEDVLAGATELLPGVLNAASATITIQNPWNAVDRNEGSFSQINSVAGVAAYAQLTTVFSSVSLPGDSLYIIISTGGSLLGLNLLDGFVIQRYFGETPVGGPIASGSSLLDLKLLAGGTQAAVILNPTPEPYDRVQLRYGGVANVLNNIRIHEIYRVAGIAVEGADEHNALKICQGEPVQLSENDDMCTTYKWYNAPTGGAVIAEGLSYLPPSVGTHVYYVQPIRYGCEILKRGVIQVSVFSHPQRPHLTITNVNN